MKKLILCSCILPVASSLSEHNDKAYLFIFLVNISLIEIRKVQVNKHALTVLSQLHFLKSFPSWEQELTQGVLLQQHTMKENRFAIYTTVTM